MRESVSYRPREIWGEGRPLAIIQSFARGPGPTVTAKSHRRYQSWVNPGTHQKNSVITGLSWAIGRVADFHGSRTLNDLTVLNSG